MKKYTLFFILCSLMLACNHPQQKFYVRNELSEIKVIFPDSVDNGVICFYYNDTGLLERVKETYGKKKEIGCRIFNEDGIMKNFGTYHSFTHEYAYHKGQLLCETITNNDEYGSSNNITNHIYYSYNKSRCNHVDIQYGYPNNYGYTNITYLFDSISREVRKLIHIWNPNYLDYGCTPISYAPHGEDILIKEETTYFDSSAVVLRYVCTNKEFNFDSMDSITWSRDTSGNTIKTKKYFTNRQQYLLGVHQWIYKNDTLVKEMVYGTLEEDEHYKYINIEHPVETFWNHDTIYKEYIYQPINIYFSE